MKLSSRSECDIGIYRAISVIRHLQTHMCVFFKEKVRGGGDGGRGLDNWDIKIFNATNCERGRRETTIFKIILKNKGHCGSDFCFLSSSV